MRSFFGLLISAIAVLLGTMYLISSPAYLVELKPIIRFMWLTVTPVAASCATTMNQVTAIVDNDDVSSKEHAELKNIVDQYMARLWRLQGFYIIASVYIFVITFLPIANHETAMILVSMGVALIFISLATYFNLRKINKDIIDFKAQMTFRAIKDSEKSDAIDRLSADSKVSDEDTEYFNNHSKVVKVKPSKR
ncbi:hypothetical protein [Aliivibrio logei]|uniref:hypothetical protein n=1 Tax=Aliivibrio logei TaxID=688 RepID=UPI0035C8D428